MLEYSFELVVLVGIHPQSTKSKYRRQNPHSRKHHCLQYHVFCGLDLWRMPCTKSEVRVANICMLYHCLPCCFTLTVFVFTILSWAFYASALCCHQHHQACTQLSRLLLESITTCCHHHHSACTHHAPSSVQLASMSLCCRCRLHHCEPLIIDSLFV